ncbi:hypothetical protein HC891_09505 [Candidatus Gracilibacteria bacterium]|nr:hypothetical protein [Candidatus Gracilibacteria bacterium]
MLTTDQIISFFEGRIAQLKLNGDREGMRRCQLALGVLIEAAEHHNDANTARRLRVLAARAANDREALEDD